MLVTTVVSLALAGCISMVSLKIGYKLETIYYILKEEPVITEEMPIIENPEVNSPFENIIKTVKQMTIDKLASGSGQERLQGEGIGLAMLGHSPIFGLGFGSYRTFSLFTNILLNAGILGATAYGYIIYAVASSLIKYRKKDEKMSVILFISAIGTTIAFCVGVPDLVLTFYWMMLVFAYKYSTVEQ